MNLRLSLEVVIVNIKIGQKRIAFIFRSLTIKIPKIYFIRALLVLFNRIKKGTHFWRTLKYSHQSYGSFQMFLLRGIANNLSEFVFCRRNKSLSILARTYFSFWGFINFQETINPLDISDLEFLEQMHEIIGDSLTKEGKHTFGNVKNFGVSNGKIKIVDYADFKVQNLLRRDGDRIYNNFLVKQ